MTALTKGLHTVDAGLLIGGFDDPVQQSQQLFRQLLTVTSEPGRIETVTATSQQPDGLNVASWALALSLFDADCTVWLSPSLAAQPSLISNLMFHCQTRLVEHADEADFAFCNAAELNSLQGFSFGSAEYPATSTSLIVQVPGLSGEPCWTLSGPGIETTRSVRVCGLSEPLQAELIDSRHRFPSGIDCFFSCADQLMALPRSTQITITEKEA